MQRPHPHPHAHPPRQSRPPRTEQPSRSRPRRHRRRRVVLTALACAAVLVGAGPTALGGGASPALELTRAGAAPPAATARQAEALDPRRERAHRQRQPGQLALARNRFRHRFLQCVPGRHEGDRDEAGATKGREPSSVNFLSWWDADPVRELLDGTHIDKYGPASDTRLLTGSGVHSNNSTKATPSLSGDILGDWREEVV
ncbi:hypothetical protein QFZ56_006478 [Streptomyces achromogenes]|uniref:Rhamnogalacturonan lyase family 11 C-terminal domain-containing protein n=1 Tax=Streptomyces achromogenes TaxID=67255 RepID=A0ABU0QA25_STRAH|nr:hypothetical protein [Streptomyces achromogenes]